MARDVLILMKYFLIIILFFVAFFCEAQPLPKCFNATKRLFIKSNDKIKKCLKSYQIENEIINYICKFI